VEEYDVLLNCTYNLRNEYELYWRQLALLQVHLKATLADVMPKLLKELAKSNSV
jgi:hypothetical protein